MNKEDIKDIIYTIIAITTIYIFIYTCISNEIFYYFLFRFVLGIIIIILSFIYVCFQINKSNKVFNKKRSK